MLEIHEFWADLNAQFAIEPQMTTWQHPHLVHPNPFCLQVQNLLLATVRTMNLGQKLGCLIPTLTTATPIEAETYDKLNYGSLNFDLLQLSTALLPRSICLKLFTLHYGSFKGQRQELVLGWSYENSNDDIYGNGFQGCASFGTLLPTSLRVNSSSHIHVSKGVLLFVIYGRHTLKQA